MPRGWLTALLTCASGAAAGPLVSSGFPVDLPVTVAAPSYQGEVAVARGPAGWLVAWSDLREENSNGAIFCARLADDGSVLDPGGLALTPMLGDRHHPAVGSDGTQYLVVWEERSAGTSDLWGRVVSAAGAPGPPLPLVTAAGNQQLPQLAFDGTDYLLVWQDDRGDPGDIYAARVTPQGAVLDGTGVLVSGASGTQSDPGVACDTSNCLVAWSDARGADADLYAARVDRNGSVLDAAGVPLVQAAGDQRRPRLAFDGTQYLVVWTDTRSMTIQQAYAARVTPAPANLDATGFPLVTPAAMQTEVTVAWDGTHFFAAWTDWSPSFDCRGTRVDPTGAVLDSPPLAISTGPQFEGTPALAGGPDVLVVWDDDRSGGALDDAYAARLTPQGNKLDPGIRVSSSGNPELHPALATDGTVYLAAWEDARTVPAGVWLARLGAGGEMLDPNAIALPSPSDGGIRDHPALAYGAGVFLAVWREGFPGPQGIHAARLDGLGHWLDVPELVLAAGPSRVEPSVAFDGADFVVAWKDSTATPVTYTVRVAPDGTVLGPAFAVSPGANLQTLPLAQRTGGGALVSWSDYAQGLSVVGAVISDGGLAAPAFRLTGPNVQEAPAAGSFDGTDTYFLWRSSHDVRGRVLGPDDGGVLAYELYSSTAPVAGTVAAAWDGTHHLLAWMDAPDSGAGLLGAWTAGAGPLETFDLSRLGDEADPALAFASPDGGLLLYSRFDADAGARRLEARLLGLLRPGDYCGAATQACYGSSCQTGYCCPSSCTTGCVQGRCVDGGTDGGEDGGADGGDGGASDGGDGGTLPDGGVGHPHRPLHVGCDCGEGGALWPAAALLLALRKKRRGLL